jgi:DNA-damage-inducible protein J
MKARFMAATALVQTRIDPNLKERAALVLEQTGLTISEAVRIMLTRTANEGALPFALASDSPAHGVWFRAKVQAALADLHPGFPHEEVETYFAAKREAALRRGAGNDA